MDESPASRSIAASLRRLTLAVWIIAIVLLIQFVLTLYAYWSPGDNLAYERMVATEIESGRQLAEARALDERDPRSLEQSLEQRLAQARLAIVVEYESEPDGRQRAVIRQFLRQSPDLPTPYKVGDEYPGASYFPRAGQHRGDGAVLVLDLAAPHRMNSSVSIHGGRIPALGDITIEQLRERLSSDLPP